MPRNLAALSLVTTPKQNILFAGMSSQQPLDILFYYDFENMRKNIILYFALWIFFHQHALPLLGPKTGWYHATTVFKIWLKITSDWLYMKKYSCLKITLWELDTLWGTATFHQAPRKNVGHFFRSEKGYWAQNYINLRHVHSLALCDYCAG